MSGRFWQRFLSSNLDTIGRLLVHPKGKIPLYTEGDSETPMVEFPLMERLAFKTNDMRAKNGSAAKSNVEMYPGRKRPVIRARLLLALCALIPVATATFHRAALAAGSPRQQSENRQGAETGTPQA